MGILALSLVSAATASIYFARIAPSSPEQAAGLGAEEAEVLAAVNEERARAGLKPLLVAPRLAALARAHSDDMAINNGRGRATLESTAPAAGAQSTPTAENIYIDDDANPAGLGERAVQSWLGNPERRAAMLSDRFARSAVGVARSAGGHTYVTEEFVR
jgi:uncharacterized protein YkwD